MKSIIQAGIQSVKILVLIDRESYAAFRAEIPFMIA